MEFQNFQNSDPKRFDSLDTTRERTDKENTRRLHNTTTTTTINYRLAFSSSASKVDKSSSSLGSTSDPLPDLLLLLLFFFFFLMVLVIFHMTRSATFGQPLDLIRSSLREYSCIVQCLKSATEPGCSKASILDWPIIWGLFGRPKFRSLPFRKPSREM